MQVSGGTRRLEAGWFDAVAALYCCCTLVTAPRTASSIARWPPWIRGDRPLRRVGRPLQLVSIERSGHGLQPVVRVPQSVDPRAGTCLHAGPPLCPGGLLCLAACSASPPACAAMARRGAAQAAHRPRLAGAGGYPPHRRRRAVPGSPTVRGKSGSERGPARAELGPAGPSVTILPLAGQNSCVTRAPCGGNNANLRRSSLTAPTGGHG
jgi:hypothetical protein